MLDTLIADKVISSMGDDTLRVGGVKIFADGSLGAQTAYMKKPYRGKKDDCGVAVTDLDDLTLLVGKAVRNNLACAIHAIGDRAVANVITAYLSAGYRSHLRNRIEHLQLISREDIPRLMKSRVVASMQPSHCPSDRRLVAAYWGERGRNAYIFKTLLNHGIRLTFGSDCPIEPLDPLGGIHAAVNRNGFGERGGRFHPEERLTVAQGVHGFTAGPAFASGRESFAGRIAPGHQADLVILDDDIYSMRKSDIYKAQIAATVFDGTIVYDSGSLELK
jgi:predicted amidohydrolase YtcJ